MKMKSWSVKSMIVATGVTSKGVEYAIDDRYMAPPGSDLERRIIEEQRRAAYEILKKAVRRKEQESA